MEESENGAIYLSFGSNVKESYIRKDKIQIMFNVLSTLPQKVFWKWNNDDRVPGKADNIIYKKWFPQGQILSNENVKLFITHGGQGSVIESLYHGVPMLGIPLFGDQNANTGKMVKSGFGLKLDYLTLTEESFRSSIEEILKSPVYAENIQRAASIYKDRPMTPQQTALYWVEYILRHRGAPHMQSPAVHMNRFQRMSLDVIGFLLFVLYVLAKVFMFAIKKLFCIKESAKHKKE